MNLKTTLNKCTIIVVFLILGYNTNAQTEVWVKKYGNSGTPEYAYDVEIDKSGNIYTTGQYNSSVNFDGLMSVDYGYSSLFITKSNDDGQSQWLVMGGGTNPTGQTRMTGNCLAVDSTNNVYLSGSYSNGPAYFNGTLLNGTNGSFLTKMDTAGNVLWIKCFTSTTQCATKSIVIASNGDVIVYGDYITDIAFIGGPNYISKGNTDLFIATYSSGGIFKWAKSFGSIDADGGNDIALDASDNIYITGFNKDTLDIDGILVPPYSTTTLYYAKLDLLGNGIWATRDIISKGIGKCIILDKDKNIYIGGSNDKFNYLAKYDSLGTKLWSKTGTTSFNFSTSISDISFDKVGGIYVVGSYYMELTMGSKSLGNSGFNNIFVAKYTKGGTVTWLEKYEGADTDFGHAIKLDPYSGYLCLAGQSNPNGSNNPDAIIIRHKVSIITNTLNGRLFIDLNQNGINDTTDIGVSNVAILSTSPSGIAITDSLGNYVLNIDDTVGNVELIFPQNLPGWNIVTDSLTYTIDIYDSLTIINNLDFGIYSSGNPASNFLPSITGGFPRCNDTVNYWVSLQNLGNNHPKGIIELTLDDSLTYLNSSIPPNNITGTTYTWNYDTMSYFQNNLIELKVIMPPFSSMGDTLKSLLVVKEQDLLFNTLHTEIDSLEQVSVCAYDPNDKSVFPKGKYVEGYIPNNQELTYLIRFQNTGNDTAATVVIKDLLDENLDWTTLQLVSSSDLVQYTMEYYRSLKFTFLNIMLPDSGTDFLGSQGFVKFKIKPLPNLLPNTPISNSASIYFDNNPAVITNIVLNTIDTATIILGVNEIINHSKSDILIYPNPTLDILNVSTELKINVITIYELSGRVVKEIKNPTNSIGVSDLKNGIYFIKISTPEGMFTKKFIKQ